MSSCGPCSHEADAMSSSSLLRRYRAKPGASCCNGCRINDSGMGMLRARTVTGCNVGRTTGAAKGIATAGDDGSDADPVMPNDSSAVSGVGSAGATSSKGSTGPGASPSRSGSDVAGASVSRLKRYAEVSVPSPSSMSSSIRDRSPSVMSPSGAIHVGAGDAGRRTFRCPEGLAMTVASGYAAINSACIAGSFSHRQRAG